MTKLRVLKPSILLSVVALMIVSSRFEHSAFAAETETPAGPAVQKAQGATVFAAKCAFCHSKDGRGMPNWKAKGQPDFTDQKWQQSRTDAQLMATIKEDKGKFMPAWKDKLSEGQITALVGQIRSFGKGK